MSWTKGTPRTEEFKLFNKIHTLLLYALGCCKKPTGFSHEVSDETKLLLSKTLTAQRNTPEWSVKLREQGKKCRNISNWRASLSQEESKLHSAKVGAHNASIRENKTYADIYGEERVLEEIVKRTESNRKYWDRRGRKLDDRPYQAGAKYNAWRNAVFERDNHTCQCCGTKGGNLNSHHILHWVQFPEMRYDIDNGVTLCESPCHKQLHQAIRMFTRFMKQIKTLQFVEDN